MKIIISVAGFYFGPGGKLPEAKVLRSKSVHPDKFHLLLAPGRYDYVNLSGEEVIITGDEYCIGYRNYPLGEGCGIEAIITDKGTIVPKLRKATGKERYINDKEKPTNTWWPMIIKVE